MKPIFRATTPADRTALTDLFRQAFGVNSAPSLADPMAMAWRYWDPREDWAEPRSYVLEKDGRVVAHAGLWPLTFAGEHATRGIQMIDWCAALDSPGAGLALVQKFVAMFDFIYSIGGSEATLKILPAFGFTEVGRAWIGARPLRPFRQILTHPGRKWKLPPRLARNVAWSYLPLRRSASGWDSVAIDPDEIPSELFACREPVQFSPRSPGFFKYLSRCPSIKFQLFAIRKQGAIEGIFASGISRGQARIAGVWLRLASEEHLRIAYSLAEEAALRFRDACEVVARGSVGSSDRAAVHAGFRLVRNVPVYLFNKAGKLKLAPDFQFQLCDDDAAFLDSGKIEYYT